VLASDQGDAVIFSVDRGYDWRISAMASAPFAREQCALELFFTMQNKLETKNMSELTFGLLGILCEIP
jgi:hypothetical protein